METKIVEKKPSFENKIKSETEFDDSQQLKGTFVSVLLLGGFIVLSWLGIYWLYMSRL